MATMHNEEHTSIYPIDTCQQLGHISVHPTSRLFGSYTYSSFFYFSFRGSRVKAKRIAQNIVRGEGLHPASAEIVQNRCKCGDI